MNGYSITNEGACIVFKVDQSVKRLMKHHVVAVNAYNDRIVEIELSTPLKKIVITARTVVTPEIEDAYDLSERIAAMITDCVCCKFIINPV